MKWILVSIGVCCLTVLLNCSEQSNVDTIDQTEIITDRSDGRISDISNENQMDSTVIARLKRLNLVDVQDIDSNIFVDLKYAGTDNFMGVKLYDTLKKVFLQKDVAIRLSKCQRYLDSIKPGYHLLVYDGVRPLQVQQEMWEALDSIPVWQRGRFVSNPVFGSVHNFGAAVDLTIIDSSGGILDMGAGYDDFRAIAFPKLEARFLKSGELTKKQHDNRKLLRRTMRSQRFRNIPSEWWHFNAFPRISASHKFQLLITESGDAKWFKIVPEIPEEVDSIQATDESINFRNGS